MYKLHHLVAKHKIAAFFILTIFTCGVYTILLMQLHIPTWALIIVNLVLAFIIYAYVEYSPDPIMRKAFVELNDNCNPYPLLEETEKLLTYKNSEVVHQTILINHAVALRSIGEYQRNFDVLRTLNIDKAAGMLPINKVVYYNNLMDACGVLEKYEEADVWYSKMMLIHGDITNQKQLETVAHTIQCAKAFHYYYEKDYQKALIMLREAKAKDRRESVDSAMLCAKIGIAMGDIEMAKKELQYVMENGNRLYAVTEAKNLYMQF